jgi:ribosomal-protein-alanine N-acetyltransferase
VRTMRLEDLPTVMEVGRQCLPTPWSEVVWREELRSPFSLYLVLVEGGAVSGYIGVKLVADEMHIMTVAVHLEHRRKGFTRALIKTALATHHPPARRVYLEVRPSNLPARMLYESLGFIQTSVRPGYYDDEDALLLTLNLDA